MPPTRLVENYHEIYDPERPFQQHSVDLLVKRQIAPWLAGDCFAELGISTGIFSVRIAPFAKRMVLVDGNATYCEHVEGRLRELGVECVAHCCMLEDLDPSALTGVTDFFLISMIHVLPGIWPGLLEQLAKTAEPGARIHVTMSNRLAPNRLLGFHMGLIPSLDEPDEVGEQLNTVYVERAEVEAVAERAGLTVKTVEGFLCRPVPLAVLDEVIDERGMELLWQMGRSLPPEFSNSTYFCLEV